MIDFQCIVHLARCHVEFVKHIPQTNGLGQQGNNERQQTVEQQADVEGGIRVAIGPAHLCVEKARRRLGERATDKSEHGQHATHNGKQSKVGNTEYLQHKARGVEGNHGHRE